MKTGRPVDKNRSMDPAIELTIDVRPLPASRREEAVLRVLSTLRSGRAVLVVSDAGFHALEADLALDYPGKFVVRRLLEAPRRHRLIIAKTGDTPTFRARWESALDTSWSPVRDP